MNPLKAKPGGVLERTGHTEASVDLARLAGLIPAGLICEVMNDDGTMARVDDLVGYCAKHGLKMITIKDLIVHRRRSDQLVERVVSTRLPTGFGIFEAVGYRSLVDDKHHLALVKGDVAGKDGVLVRVHSECLTGDVFHSERCDCGGQLHAALTMIEQEGEGVLLYLAQEGRGIGLLNKLRAYKLQEEGLDTVEANEQLGLPADLRDFGIGAQILSDLGLSSIRILTNNPKKIHALEGYGLSVTDQIPIEQPPNPENVAYLRTKREKLGHTLHHQGLDLDGEMLLRERCHDRAPRRPAHARPLMARYAIVVARFYEDLAERLERGARAVFEAATAHAVEVFDVQGAFELAARGRLRGASGPLRRRRLPRRRDPRRDRPLRLRLRRRLPRNPARLARQRRALLLRRAHRRHLRAGARALRRRQARQRRACRARGARARRRSARSWRSARLPTPWPRSVTPARRVPRSATTAATRWSRPAGASTRTSRRSASSRTALRAASTSARAASRPARSPRPL